MEIVSPLIESGCYSAVFAVLLVYHIRNSGRREEYYRAVISELADSLGQLDVMNGRMDRITELCERLNAPRGKRRERCVCEAPEASPSEVRSAV